MVFRPCPHCGHSNLPRALDCTECGTRLEAVPILPGMKPHYHAVVEGDGDVEPIEPRSIDGVNSNRETREKSELYNAQLTCLRCGSVNEPQTAYCQMCGAALIVADEISGLKVRASALTSVGQLRTNNEDTVGLWARKGAVLALVADGMGGAAAGEEASRMTREAVQVDFIGLPRGSESLQELSELELMRKLRLAIDHANEALLHRIEDEPGLQGMGTTSTLAIVRGNRILIAHVGDSRAYLVDNDRGWIHQMTDDHSFVEALLASGHITRAQAARHPMRSVLYRALGQNEALGDADVYARDIKAGDRIVLCSDGLMRHISDAEIAQIALSSDDPEEITRILVDLTNERGAEDNVSAVVLVVSASDEVIEPEHLKPLAAEAGKPSEDESVFKTGRISPEALEEARAAARKLEQDDE